MNSKKYSVKDQLLKLPEMVALWADQNGTPHEPWNKPAIATPIVVKAGVKGFWVVSPRLNPDHFNSHSGPGGTPATKAQITAMMNGSVFGFGIPISDPDEYNEDGVLHGSKLVKPSIAEMAQEMVALVGGDPKYVAGNDNGK